MAGSININQNNNQVILLDQNRQLVITNNNTNTSTNVTQPVTDVVEVKLGPKGPKGDTGPQGPIGPSGSVDTSSLVTTASFNSYTGSSDSQFLGTASFASTSSAAIINQGVSNDNQYILTVQDASDTIQQIQRPSTPFTIRPSIQNNISGESDKAAELQVGLNNQAGAISLISNLISGNPNYIKTLNQDLYLKVKNSGTGKLFISASAGVETTGNITASGNISVSGDILATTGSFEYIGFLPEGGSNITQTGGGAIVIKSSDGGIIELSDTFALTHSEGFLVNTSGDIVTRHITSSGNISASGYIQTSELKGTGTGTTQLNVLGHITASGNISSSGTVESNGLILTSLNGTRYQIRVANDGTLDTAAL